MNYGKVNHKIYHHTSNLLVHNLVKWTRMYWPTLLAWFEFDFVIKDVTFKQVTLNETDLDKINVVSSQAVLKMSSFSTRCLPRHWSLISSKIDCSKLHAPYTDEPPFQFIHTMDLSVVDTMLHDSPDLVIHRTEIWAVWRPQVGRYKLWGFLTQQCNCCTCAARCARALSCWNKLVTTRHCAVCMSLAAVWRHYDIVKQ